MDPQAALEILRTSDSFQLAQTIQASGNPAQVGETCLQLGLDLYWKSKNLRAAIVVCQMGIHYCLTLARYDKTESRTRDKLLDSAKKMAYNLASFCWPGWDEAEIVIRESDVEIGADAARLNLRLAQELNRPPPGMSMAYGMLGAYGLAQRQFENATGYFQRAMEFACEAKDDRQTALNDGFIALARLGMKSAHADDEFAKVVGSLDAMNNDDAREYARQLNVAKKVFGL